MRILISNDDGYKAIGITQLAKSLSTKHEIIIVAPSKNKSAASSSLTVDKPLKPIKIGTNTYIIDATPSDCIHLALCGFLKQNIDLVVTGINFGANLGDDVIYSGTVAGAIEGRFLGMPSIAISLTGNGKHFATAGLVANRLVANINKASLSPDTILNVNVPDIPFDKIVGFKTTYLGKRHMSGRAIKDKDNTSLYWIGENGKERDNGDGTDFYAIKNNFVSITPLHIDLTKYKEIANVTRWLDEF